MGLLNLNIALSEAGVETESSIQAEILAHDRDRLILLFADPDLTVSRVNPLKANAAGIFELCYLLQGDYRVRLSSGIEIQVSIYDRPHTADQYLTLNELEEDSTLSYSVGRGQKRVAVGDIVQVVDGSHSYRIAPPDAEDYQVRSQGGVRFYVNTNRYDLKAASFGLRLTGDPADAERNRIALQQAIDYLDSEGQGGRIRLGGEGDCIVDQPPMMKDNIQIDLGGGILRNMRTASGGGKFLSHQALQIGKMHPRHMDILLWKTLQPIGFGDGAVTLQDPLDAIGFQPGDMLLIAEAAPTLGGDSKTLPAWAQWNRVHAVSNGIIYLDRPMEKSVDAGGGLLGASAEGAWIANVAYRTRNEKPWASTDLIGWLDGAPWMAYRPSVVNGRLSTQFGGAIQGVGMFEGLWQDLRIYPGEAAEGRGFGGVYSNAFAHSRLKGIMSSAYERFIEVKCLSQHSVIEDFEVYALNHPHAPSEWQDTPIALGENSRDVVFRNGIVNLGNLGSGETQSSQNLVNFTPAYDSGFERVKFISNTSWARLVYGQPVSTGCFVRYCDFDADARVLVETEMTDFSFCHNTMRRYTPGADRYLLRLHENNVRGRINDNEFLVEGPAKILSAIEPGKVGTEINRNRGISTIDDSSNGNRAIIQGNRNKTSDAILFAGGLREERNISVTSTFESIIGTPVVIEPAQCESGDRFEWIVEGSLGGDGDKTVVWRAALDTDNDSAAIDPDDDSNIAARFIFPSSCSAFEMRVSATIHGSSTIITKAIAYDLTNNSVLVGGDVRNHTSASLGSHSLRLELSGCRSSETGNFVIRSIRRYVQRYGFEV